MNTVSIRDLRNHGGDVIDRVAAGERLTVTRNGKPVAELGPPRRLVPIADVLKGLRHLGPLDAEQFRADLDSVIDDSLDGALDALEEKYR